jgi:hypothetical protein
MIARRYTALQKLTAVVPVLLLVVAIPGQQLLRCQMDGLLRTSCCCPVDAEMSGKSVPVISAQSCCSPVAAVTDRLPAEAVRAAAGEFAWTSFQALAAPVALSAAEPARDLPVRQSHGPPGRCPSLVLLKSAFLI